MTGSDVIIEKRNVEGKKMGGVDVHRWQGGQGWQQRTEDEGRRGKTRGAAHSVQEVRPSLHPHRSFLLAVPHEDPQLLVKLKFSVAGSA
eukprot:6175-Hanusia_phi.AAC.5